MILNTSIIPMQFLPTPSARRATARKPRAGARRAYFYPRPPRGGRLMSFCVVSQSFHISTHALREEGDIRCLQTSERWPSYFYPRPPRGGRPDIVAIIQSHKEISTYALREEGDTDKTCSLHRRCRISTHALREEGDEVLPGDTISCDLFLPTPSARRATLHHQNKIAAGPYFYPRPPRGGRLEFFLADQRAEKFLPTPSARRATAIRPIGAHIEPISTHALREEGDPSASPARAYCIISTHALREEGDWTFRQMQSLIGNFYPRPPRGGRRATR